MQTALFHVNLEDIQVLAYSTSAEVQDSSRRIVLATHSNGLDISYSLSVVLARSLSVALKIASSSPHRESLHAYDDRCMEFFGSIQGGVVSRSNEPDPEDKLASIRIALMGEQGLDKTRAVMSLNAPKARALSAALFTATEAVISELRQTITGDGSGKALPPIADMETVKIASDWPGDADDMAAARDGESLLADTLAATPLEYQPQPATVGNGGW